MAVARYFISILQTLLIINKLVDTISVFLYIYSIEDLPCTNPVGSANDSTTITTLISMDKNHYNSDRSKSKDKENDYNT